METKDRIINMDNFRDIGLYHRELIKESLRIQAEISFRAGIKEVVEWLGEHRHQDLAIGYHRITFTENEWQAKLKEWKLEV